MARNTWNMVWRTSNYCLYSVNQTHHCTCSRKLYPSRTHSPLQLQTLKILIQVCFHWLKDYPDMLVLHALGLGKVTTSNTMCE